MALKPHNTLDEARRLLTECVLFRGLSADERQALVTRARTRAFAAGETIFLMGDPGDSMMALLKGSVRISAPSPEGKEIILGIMQPGEFFGEIALLDGKERSADAKAMTACTLAILDRRDVLAFLEQNREAWLRIVEVLCERLRRTTVQIAEVALLELPIRLAKALLRISAAEGKATSPESTVKLSQRELGHIVGATRESVNKCLREWQRGKVVQIDGISITILNRDSLEALAGTPEQ